MSKCRRKRLSSFTFRQLGQTSQFVITSISIWRHSRKHYSVKYNGKSDRSFVLVGRWMDGWMGWVCNFLLKEKKNWGKKTKKEWRRRRRTEEEKSFSCHPSPYLPSPLPHFYPVYSSMLCLEKRTNSKGCISYFYLPSVLSGWRAPHPECFFLGFSLGEGRVWTTWNQLNYNRFSLLFSSNGCLPFALSIIINPWPATFDCPIFFLLCFIFLKNFTSRKWKVLECWTLVSSTERFLIWCGFDVNFL